MSFPKVILSDFDGTLTNGLKLTPHIFEIINLIRKENSKFIIVSGRSLSWGHFLIEHLDIDFAIMEGGGVIVSKVDGKIKENFIATAQDIQNLKDSTKQLLNNFSELEESKDSLGRLTDNALELYSIENNLDNISDFMKKNKLNYSISSVHLNYWTGNFTKFSTTKKLLEDSFSHLSLDECIYFGDAPNDQSMFENIKQTVGVSNIQPYLKDMTFHPSVILQGAENKGPSGVLNYLTSLK